MKRDKSKLKLKSQFEYIRHFIEKASINTKKRLGYIVKPNRNFTRRRKLDFPTTVVFILGLLKKA